MAAILYLSLTKIVWNLKAYITSRLIYKHISIGKRGLNVETYEKTFDEMVFSSGVFLSWISLIFQFKLCLGIHEAINIWFIAMIYIP